MIIDASKSGVVKIEGAGDLILTKNPTAFELKADKTGATSLRITGHVVGSVGAKVPFRQKLRVSLKVLKYIFGK